MMKKIRPVFVVVSIFLLCWLGLAKSDVSADTASVEPGGMEEPGYMASSEPGQGPGESLEGLKERMVFDHVWPSAVPGHDYIGVPKCSLCHKTEKQG